MKGINSGANHFVAISPTWPPAYWAMPERDYAWKQMKDLGVNILVLCGGQEGNVLGIQANEQHPYGRPFDADWAENLEALLSKAASYGFKVVFHTMGSIYGTLLGVVAPMMNYRRVDPYSSIENALVVIDKLGGNNVLGKNFLADPRVAWWSPINEARLDYDDAREWTVAVLQRIKEYGGKTSVCVNDGVHGYVDCFPYIIPIIGDLVDYLQAHDYRHDIVSKVVTEAEQAAGQLEAELYQPIYDAFVSDFTSMANGRGRFRLEDLYLTEMGMGNGTWNGLLASYHGAWGTEITTSQKQQADYIRAVFDAAKACGIQNIFYHEPIQFRTDMRTFGFIEYDGTPNPEPYNAFKTGMPPPSGCFIATACGTSNTHLSTLRRFRDQCLPVTLVHAYYRGSPPLADRIRPHENVKTVFRKVIEWLTCQLKKNLML